jgi:hypothetical protein
LDELLGLEDAPAAAEAESGEASSEGSSGESSGAAAADVAETLRGETLTEAFAVAVAEMGQVAQRLDAAETGLPTRRLQQRVLDRLDQLIAAASSSPPSSSSSSSSGQGQGQGQPQDGDNQQNRPGQPGDAPAGQDPAQGQGQAQAAAGGQDGGDAGFSPGSPQDAEAAGRSLDEMRREWGALPPRLRDALSDGLDEPYSPLHRDATEAYYRRLAEEAAP